MHLSLVPTSSAISRITQSEYAALLASLEEPALSEEPLDTAELAMATTYWRLFAGNVVGDNHCEGGCSEEMPSSGLLTNNPEQVHKAAISHIGIAFESRCGKCSDKHITISEALSYHAESLRCAAVKDSLGALKALRRRDALIRIVRGC